MKGGMKGWKLRTEAGRENKYWIVYLGGGREKERAWAVKNGCWKGRIESMGTAVGGGSGREGIGKVGLQFC